MPDLEMKFGNALSLDIQWIDGDAALHAMDTATRFCASTHLEKNVLVYGQSVEGIWAAFVESWCTLYTGFPNRRRTDVRSVFTSPRWKSLTENVGTNLQVSGDKAHNSLGIGERMHDHCEECT